MIDPRTLQFLADLAANNHKEWFQDNRDKYEIARANFLDICSEVLSGLQEFQSNLMNTDVKKCVLRINRDIRFSKDKRPYKTYFAAGFGPGGKGSGQADYYLQIMPGGESFLGGGMWAPSPSNLSKWRQEIDYNSEVLKELIENKTFKSHFPERYGEQLKTTPKGYSADHPDIDLLRYKELFFYKKYTDKEVCSTDFAQNIVSECRILKPYLDYINELFFGETD
jgi:uncharacterized protein (TIGR02453 family)